MLQIRPDVHETEKNELLLPHQLHIDMMGIYIYTFITVQMLT